MLTLDAQRHGGRKKDKGLSDKYDIDGYRIDTNFNDVWGMHTWGEAGDPAWTTPRKPVSEDAFGVVFKVDLHDNAQSISYMLHRGDEKDPGPDRALEFESWGYEIREVQGVDPNSPYLELQLPAARAIACG